MPGTETGSTDNSVTPRPTSKGTATGSPASAPHTPTHLPCLCRASVARLDEAQHGRMQTVGLGGEIGLATVHRERVLREIVRADRQEIRVLRELIGQQRRRRHFDHHADFDGIRAAKLAREFIDALSQAHSSPESVTIGRRMRTVPNGFTASRPRNWSSSRSGRTCARRMPRRPSAGFVSGGSVR